MNRWAKALGQSLNAQASEAGSLEAVNSEQHIHKDEEFRKHRLNNLKEKLHLIRFVVMQLFVNDCVNMTWSLSFGPSASRGSQALLLRPTQSNSSCFHQF